MKPAGSKVTRDQDVPPLQTAVRAFESALGSGPAEISGTAIGPYKLLQKLGEGGFGTVWMAEQHEPIRRRVALKIIKVGMDTEEVIARFEVERQALALMDHPNIARVFDAGATGTGRPYFVMELVRGIAITRYCDENRVPAEARLRLFISVCQAVQHAHQKGVIHRDLKPSNILVTLHDGVPVPKIIDFGIAKATDQPLTEKTLFTQFHAFIGTPAYTSPEQMEMSGLDVDTRSDIYSLGVLLYELLAGRTPFDSDALVKSGLEAMRRTIREVDPPRPSTRLGTLPENDRTSVAQLRGTDAGKLSLLLRGDLDWIAMRCLEKDRTRRYETANALARDVQRYLAHEPVTASPPSQVYRVQKFVRRHRFGVAATVAIGVSLVGGLIVSYTSYVGERAAHTRAIVAEKSESKLRQQAENARELEAKRVGRAALTHAGQLLDEGKTPEALAYFVHAARKDPGNPTIAPRLLSVLTSRNFPLPEGAPLPCGSRIHAVQFSPDSQFIFVGTDTGLFRTIDAASGQVVRELSLAKPVQPGGWLFPRQQTNVMAVRFEDNTLGVYDLPSGRLRWQPIPLPVRTQRSPSIGGPGDPIAFSPDGRWLGIRTAFVLTVWDAATGLECHKVSIAPADGPIGYFDFSPDGTRVACTLRDTLHVWSLPAGTPAINPIPVKRNQLGFWLVTRFSPDGRKLVLCDPWAGLHIFDSRTGNKLGAQPKWEDFVAPGSIQFSSDGRLFTAGNNASGLWDLETGAFEKTSFNACSGVSRWDLDGSGQLILLNVADGYARLRNITTGEFVAEPILRQETAFEAALSPDGSRMAIGTRSGNLHRLKIASRVARSLVLPRSRPLIPAEFLPGTPLRLLWFGSDRGRVIEVASGRDTGRGFAYPEPIQKFTFSFSTRTQIAANARFAVVRPRTGPLQAWEFANDGIARVVPLPTAVEPLKFFFNTAGDQVTYIAPGGREFGVWNLRNGTQVGQTIIDEVPLISETVQASSDSRRILACTHDGRVISWDLQSGQSVLEIPMRRESTMMGADFSPDGKRILTSNGAELRLWDATTGEPQSHVAYHNDNRAHTTFSPDGRRVAAFGAIALRFWDELTLAPLGDPISITGGRSGTFSPDGERFIITQDTGIAQVWDVRTGQPVTEPMRHGPLRLPLGIFSPDGRFVRTETSGATTYHVWAVPPPQPEGTLVPEWLLQLATIFASRMVDDDGRMVDASDALAKIDDLHRQLAVMPDRSPFVEWGRWIVDDRPNRSIAPGFSITPADADKLARELAAAAAAAPL